jgi:hypothetical protein
LVALIVQVPVNVFDVAPVPKELIAAPKPKP